MGEGGREGGRQRVRQRYKRGAGAGEGDKHFVWFDRVPPALLFDTGVPLFGSDFVLYVCWERETGRGRGRGREGKRVDEKGREGR